MVAPATAAPRRQSRQLRGAGSPCLRCRPPTPRSRPGNLTDRPGITTADPDLSGDGVRPAWRLSRHGRSGLCDRLVHRPLGSRSARRHPSIPGCP